MDRKALSAAFPVTVPVLMGYLAIGIAFGLMLQEIGYNFIWAFFMSLTIYAGSGQYLGVSLLSSAAALSTVAVMTLLINFRHLVYGLSMIGLYTASTLYHCVNTTVRGRLALRKYDHCSIYLLIAGSYTPFCVVLLPQPRGTQFCLILWGVALAGVLAKMLWINAPRMLSTAVYLIMGWSVVFVAKDFTALGQPCLTLVALGGICYSVGAVFYAVKKPNISAEWTFHELFHLLILAGSFFHYLAVYLYVL